MKTRWTEANAANDRRFVIPALICGVPLAMPFAAHARQYRGTITGSVTDLAGAAIAGTAVTAQNTVTNATYKAITSKQGVYSFPHLPVGVYEIHVKQGSFREFLAKGAEVHISTANGSQRQA
jgi:carboxypeptidase family protein